MYQDYFGFQEMPFNITPDPKFLYLSQFHNEALQHLKYGIEEKKGFIVLTGEVGCGKTTLCRRLLNELDPNHYETALILNPRVTETQLLRAILTELGVEKPPRGKNELIDKIYALTLAKHQAGKDVVMIIDEAQNLSFEVLEQVRLLSNLETDTQKLMQIILIGQPELSELLDQKTPASASSAYTGSLRSFTSKLRRYHPLYTTSIESCRFFRPSPVYPGCGKTRVQMERWNPSYD